MALFLLTIFFKSLNRDPDLLLESCTLCIGSSKTNDIWVIVSAPPFLRNSFFPPATSSSSLVGLVHCDCVARAQKKRYREWGYSDLLMQLHVYGGSWVPNDDTPPFLSFLLFGMDFSGVWIGSRARGAWWWNIRYRSSGTWLRGSAW